MCFIIVSCTSFEKCVAAFDRDVYFENQTSLYVELCVKFSTCSLFNTESHYEGGLCKFLFTLYAYKQRAHINKF